MDDRRTPGLMVLERQQSARAGGEMRSLAARCRHHLHFTRHRALCCLVLLAGGCTVPVPDRPPSESEFRALLAQGPGSNFAVTEVAATDSSLRPHHFPAPPALMRDRVLSIVRSLPRWQVRDTSGAVLWVTRTTRLFRFVDDLYILIDTSDSGSLVLVRSASRVGKGDLGQNRRNIIELWTALGRGTP